MQGMARPATLGVHASGRRVRIPSHGGQADCWWNVAYVMRRSTSPRCREKRRSCSQYIATKGKAEEKKKRWESKPHPMLGRSKAMTLLKQSPCSQTIGLR
ncbi:hypothetical protein VUR80DRAFT_1082 [Thermomyces stellatus]